MGRICSPFIAVECSMSCGFTRLYNQPDEEQQKEIMNLERCPDCGAPVRRITF